MKLQNMYTGEIKEGKELEIIDARFLRENDKGLEGKIIVSSKNDNTNGHYTWFAEVKINPVISEEWKTREEEYEHCKKIVTIID